MEGQARTHFSLGKSSRNQPRAAHAAASRLPRKDRCVPLKRTARQVARLRRRGFQDGIVGLLASQLRVRQRVQGRQVGVRTVDKSITRETGVIRGSAKSGDILKDRARSWNASSKPLCAYLQE